MKLGKILQRATNSVPLSQLNGLYVNKFQYNDPYEHKKWIIFANVYPYGESTLEYIKRVFFWEPSKNFVSL